jgi:hypothetical protein
MQIVITVCAAVMIAVALYVEKRRSAGFYSRLDELYQERARFWRKRLLLADPARPDADVLRAQCHQHSQRVRQLTDELRTRYRDESAKTEVVTSSHDMELRAMTDTLARPTPDAAEQQAAKQFLSTANQSVSWVAPKREGVLDWAEFARLAAVGAVVGAYLAYTLPKRFLIELPPDFDRMTAAMRGAPVGAAAGVMLSNWFGPLMKKKMRPALISVGVLALGMLVLEGPPSPGRTREVLRAMVSETGCPRAMPPVGRNDASGLSAEEQCAVVRRAATLVADPADGMQAMFGVRNLPGISVESLAETEGDAATATAAAWVVTFAAAGGVKYGIHVSKSTGEAGFGSVQGASFGEEAF